MKKDTLQILKDSLRILTEAKLKSSQTDNSELFNYSVGIIGVLSALITFYLFYQWYKSKRLQDFVFNQAKIALEKEATQEKLNSTKQELNNVESRITQLQKQIQKDLPIEARKAVLKDRLEESLENLKKYYDDVTSTKQKLARLGETTEISDVLLKNIQQEIEPRFLIKEKISSLKTYLTIASTLAGIVFAILPNPFDNFIGVTLLLIGLPLAIQLFRLSIVKNSKDKHTTNLQLKFWLSAFGTLITIICAIFFWTIFLTSRRQYAMTDIQIIATVLTICALILTPLSLRFYKKYKLLKE